MKHHFYDKLNGWPSAIIGIIVLSGVVGYGAQTYKNLEIERVDLLTKIEAAKSDNLELIKLARERKDTIDSFQGQIQSIGSTVGVLEKLSQTDEELLKKYSKVYFLNENYIPSRLVDIDKMYLNIGSTNTMINADVAPYLERLLQKANQDGIKLIVASAYRSFSTQSSLKSSYKVTYGTGANKFSADQGYSEHQLGTALDFTTVVLGNAFSGFGIDPAFKWMLENAHNYGFILSYPKSNTYYQYEPWHWRFVGVALATKLHDEGKYFYDLDQREIDAYLIKLFD